MSLRRVVVVLLLCGAPLRGQELASFDGLFDSVTFSPDGKTLAASGERETGIRFWDVAAKKEIDFWKLEEVRAVRFSPDGTSIAAVSSRGIHLLPIASKKVRLLGEGQSADHVAFSPDGELLATAERRDIIVWQVASGTKRLALTVSEGSLSSLRFSRDGSMIAAANRFSKVHVWRIATGEVIGDYPSTSRTAFCAVFSPDGKKLLVGKSGKIVTIDMSSGEETVLIDDPDIRDRCDLDYSPDGKKVAVIGESGPRVLDGETGRTLLKCQGPVPGGAVMFSPDGKLMASVSGLTLKLWDAIPAEASAVFRGHSDAVGTVAFSADGKWAASGDSEGTIRIWDVSAGTERSSWKAHEGEVHSIAFSPKGATLASGGRDGTAKLWEVATGKATAELKKHKADVFCVAFSKDGKLVATGSGDRTIQIFDTATGERKVRIKSDKTPQFTTVAFHPDGARILAGGEPLDQNHRGIVGYDSRSGEEIFVIPANQHTIRSLALSPDGKRVVAGAQNRIVSIFDCETKAEVLELRGNQWEIYSVAYSPDGGRVATAGKDGIIELWDSESGVRKAVLEGHEGPVFSVAFSGDGRKLVTGGEDRTVRVWPVK